jgi:preprotein translocase subunit SecE
LYIWIGLLVVAFGLAWYGGQLTRLANYWRETMEEMKKCTWPTWAELRGSTLVVFIAIAILGVFTFVVDLVFRSVIRILT